MKFFITIIFSISIIFAYTINFSYVTSSDTPKGEAALIFKKELEKASNGQIKVNLYPNSKNERFLIQQLQKNEIQMIAPSISKLTLFLPKLEIFDLPFLFKNKKHLYKILDGKIGKELLKELSSQNFLALTYWDNGFKKLTNDTRELKSPEDCKNLRFRIMNSKVLIEQFKILDAIPIILPFSATYQALKERVVNGEENTISNIYSKKFYKVQKYMTLSNHGYLGYIVIINKNFFQTLPPELQRVVRETLQKVTLKERELANEYNKKLLKKIQESSIKISSLSPQEKKMWREKLKKIYPLFYKEVGRDLIKKIEKEGEKF